MRQGDLEFKARLDYIERPCLKLNTKQNNIVPNTKGEQIFVAKQNVHASQIQKYNKDQLKENILKWECSIVDSRIEELGSWLSG